MTDIDWREYEPAIRRHEAMSGRDHPHPVDAEGRLSPKFVEWMMALPEGHVTDVDISKTQQLACLGRGVVPAQGAAAFAALLGIEFHTHTHTHTHISELLPTPTSSDSAGPGWYGSGGMDLRTMIANLTGRSYQHRPPTTDADPAPQSVTPSDGPTLDATTTCPTSSHG